MILNKFFITKNILLALLCLALSILFFHIQYKADNKYTAPPPYGNTGHFAFTTYDLESDRPLFLIDGWEFYADNWLSPTDLSDDSIKPTEIVFIGKYPNFSFFSYGHSPFGKATYRMCLDYNGSALPLTLEVPEIFTDYTLWINGEEMSVGNGSVTFVAKAETELVIAVANQSHYYSGLTYPPSIGLPRTISHMFLVRNLFYALLCVFPLALCFYAAASFAQRKSNRLLLHFGLLCFFFALHCAHPFIHQLGLSGRLWYALEDASWLMVLYEAIILSSIHAGFYNKHWFAKVIRPLCLLCCLLCVTGVLFILPNFGSAVLLYGTILDIYKILCWLYLLVCAVLGICRALPGNGLLLSGGAILGASMAMNLFDNNRFEPIYTGWQTEYAAFFLVIIFWVLTVRYTRELLRQNQQLTLHLEEAVEKRTAELNAVLQERKAFFSDLAHNLKAPMSSIHGFTELITRQDIYLDNELKEYFSKIREANDELSRRVEVLGELNAFDKLTHEASSLDVNELLALVYANNEPEASISGIHLLVEQLECPAHIYAPKQRLLLLFENLIYNAFSFTPEDGSITVHPRLDNGCVVITVSDTGTGIAPEHLPHIFERFYMYRNDTSSGSGLGLYMVHLTMTELGGHISVDSVVGKGTTFTLYFPAL